jgi:glucan biosynthesis protein C
MLGPMSSIASANLPSAERFHAIDALRALAMFLGVVLHSSLGFMHEESEFTPRMDRSRCIAFDLEVYGVHAFRMQLFFVVAGFFTGLLLARRTPGEFAIGRLKRVGLPLLAGSLIIVPLTRWPLVLGRGGDAELKSLYGGAGHLWFLIYLGIFSAAAWALAVLVRRWRLDVSPAMNKLADCAASHWAVPLLAIPTVLLNMLMSGWFIDTPWKWMPHYSTLAYYGFFFVVGVAVQRRGVVSDMGRSWKWQLPVAILVLFPAMVVVGSKVPATAVLVGERTLEQRASIIGAAAVQALFTWGMIVGLFGLFTRLCAVSRAWVRWLADSSYWVYLWHLPAVYWLQFLLADKAIPGMSAGPLEACIKFSAILTAVLSLTLGTYAVLVRPTWLESVVGGGGKGAKVNRRSA